jgi:hypothetical protein
MKLQDFPLQDRIRENPAFEAFQASPRGVRDTRDLQYGGTPPTPQCGGETVAVPWRPTNSKLRYNTIFPIQHPQKYHTRELPAAPMFFLFSTWREKTGCYRRKSRADAFPDPHHVMYIALTRP